MDRTAHLAWINCLHVQETLASSAGDTAPARGRAVPEEGFGVRLTIDRTGPDGVIHVHDVGRMSESFQQDLKRLWGRVDKEGRLRPPLSIPHLYLVGVTTVGLTEAQRALARPPFNQSGLALAPVIKGFPLIQFLYRNRGRTFR